MTFWLLKSYGIKLSNDFSRIDFYAENNHFLPNITAQVLITNITFFKCNLILPCLIDFPDLSLSSLPSGTIKQPSRSFLKNILTLLSAQFFRPGALNWDHSSWCCHTPTFTLVSCCWQLVPLPTGTLEGALGVFALPIHAEVPLLTFINICKHNDNCFK